MGPGPRGRAAACIPRSGSAALNRAPARLAAEEGTEEEEEEAGSEQALVHQASKRHSVAHSRGTSRGVLRDTPPYRSAQSTVDTRRVDPLQCPRLRLLSALSCDSIWTGAGAYTRTPRASLPGTSARRRRVTRPTDPRPGPSAFSPAAGLEPPRPNPRRSARRAARAGGGSIRRFVSATRRAACGQERTRAGGARARRDHGAPPQLAHGRRGAHLHGGRSLGVGLTSPDQRKKASHRAPLVTTSLYSRLDL